MPEIEISLNKVQVIDTMTEPTRERKSLRLAIARGVDSVPQKYLAGLGNILLRDHAAFSRQEKKSLRRARGAYFKGAEPPYIEIYVDHIKRGIPYPLSSIAPIRDYCFLRIVFHEIGHHIDRKIIPKGKGSEKEARHWENALLRCYYRKQYSRFRFLAPILRRFVKPLRLVARWLKRG